MKINNFINLSAFIFLFYTFNSLPPLYGYKPNDEQIIQGKSDFLKGATPYIKGFEPNLGQIGNLEGEKVNDVLFFTSHNGIDLFVRKEGVSYVIKKRMIINDKKIKIPDERKTRINRHINEEEYQINWARIDVDLLNANLAGKEIEYEEQLPGYTNYYLSHCPEGVLFVPSYKVARIKDVYPNIDWVWRIGDDGLLHHEFKIREGGEISNIKLEVKWADVKLSDNGKSLILSTPVGEIKDGEILAFYDGGKVDLKYAVEEGKYIAFNVDGKYKGTLTIDPPLSRLWATYYGGNGDDIGYSITTDADNNVLVTGITESTNFPTKKSGYMTYFQGYIVEEPDAFILKFSSSGRRLWATYYGGNYSDYGVSITTDADNNVYVTGRTESDDFPTYNPGGWAYFQEYNAGGWDAFILKFSSYGERLWATYYGGIYDDKGWSITTDANNNVLVTGETVSTNFPTYNPGGGAYFEGVSGWITAAFILKFSSSGKRLWATLYGRNAFCEGRSITTDADNNVYVTGVTGSTDFPTYNPGGGAYFQGYNAGSPDAFILKFSSSGKRLWATYYGGDGEEWSCSITTDGDNNVYVTGRTMSTNFPTYNPGGGAYFQGFNGKYWFWNAFILKFSSSGQRLWATYYGGSSSDGGWSITTDADNNVYVTGETSSTDFPTYNPGGGAYFEGVSDWTSAFILKFSSSGKRLWATLYGRNAFCEGRSITTDADNNVYVTGVTGSTDFPTYNPGGGAYFQGQNAEEYDAFILKFSGLGSNGFKK